MNDFSKEETSLVDVIITIKKLFKFIIKSKILFFIIFISIFSIKLISFYLTPDTYLAKMTFVIENSMSIESTANSGGLSNMASQLGVNLPGSNSNSVDYISSKNLNTFFNSFSLISKVLNSSFDTQSKSNFSKAYAKLYKLDTSLSENELNRVIYENIIKNEFKIEPLKGSSFLEIKTEMRDPRLSVFFEKHILHEAMNEYTKLKIGKQVKILEKTQKTADSLSLLLNMKAIRNYKQQEGLFNSNQAFLTNRAIVDETSRDKQFLLSLYGQIIAQLNSTKMLINQETPYIQVLDDIQTPINTSKNTFLYGTIIAILLGLFSSITIVSLIYFLRTNPNE